MLNGEATDDDIYKGSPTQVREGTRTPAIIATPAPITPAPVPKTPAPTIESEDVSVVSSSPAQHDPLIDVLNTDMKDEEQKENKKEENNNKQSDAVSSGDGAATSSTANHPEKIHWVFTTDCSVYQFNQGNVLLESAAYLNVSGEFTWIMYGCTTAEQKEEMKKLGHPRARVWHVPQGSLTHPDTGEVKPHFQASNRPYGLWHWWQGVREAFTEDAVGILDPDEAWMRPVVLTRTETSYRAELRREPGPWRVPMVTPKHGSGAYYAIGCVGARHKGLNEAVCRGRGDACTALLDTLARQPGCGDRYGSGPPWILHKSDIDDVFGVFLNTAIRTHEIDKGLLSEQFSFGLSQMIFNITNTLDSFWFVSDTHSHSQPYMEMIQGAPEYDPCEAQLPPDPRRDLGMPPLWHSCSSYFIPKDIAAGHGHFGLHKDHIHKDIFDCDAPLLKFPPKDALKQVRAGMEMQPPKYGESELKGTYGVCNYINIWNFYVASYKRKFCSDPNLAHTQEIFPHAASFLNDQSRLKKIFRKGGWTDVDYKVGLDDRKVEKKAAATTEPLPSTLTKPPPTDELVVKSPQNNAHQGSHWPGSSPVAGEPPSAIAVLLTTTKRTPRAATLDAMGVLRHSILATNPRRALHFVCMYTADVPREWIDVARRLGWDPQLVESPVQPSDCRNPQIEKELPNDGAMGITEMVKLKGFLMNQFHRVVMIDADFQFHKDFDEILEEPATLQWTEGNPASFEHLNGGFLVFNPHNEGRKHYDAILEIWKECDFQSGSGWRGKGIGWTYGGRTIQGILPHYILKEWNPRTDKVLDRCRFNNMVQMDRCKSETPIDQVVSNHFTGSCMKPWDCGGGGNHPMCREFFKRWWDSWDAVNAEHQTTNSTRHCRTGGEFKSIADALIKQYPLPSTAQPE